MISGSEVCSLRVLMVTSEWPTAECPMAVPFIVRQVEYLRRTGITVDVFPFRGAKKLTNYLSAWKELRDKLKHDHYDLIHAQFGQSGLLALPTSLPLVATFRGDDLLGIVGPSGNYTFAGRLLQLVSQIVAYFADESIVVSKALGQKIPRRSYSVIPSGVDLDLFCLIPVEEARRRLQLPQDKQLVLFASSAHRPEKRYGLAHAAIEHIGEEHALALIVPEAIPHDLMPLYMNACDVLLLTSLHEGSPDVVKEALACNLPIVSTDVGDVRERIEGVEGCAVVSDSPDEIASALAMVLKRNRRTESRAMVATVLNESVITDQVIDVYQRAVRKQRCGRDT